MVTDFSLINSEAQAKTLAGQEAASRRCHSCGSSEVYNTGSNDEWGYRLYRCAVCGDLCEFWEES